MNITNELITSYLDALYAEGSESLRELRCFAEERKVPIIRRDTEGLLVGLFKIKKPRCILEIGTAVGYSACCFAEACDCDVITIESDEKMCEIAESNIKNLGFSSRVHVMHGDARDILCALTDANGKSGRKFLFDIVFIDAAKSHYKEFWDLSLPLCRDDAMIVCDNVLMNGMTVSDEFDPVGRFKTSIKKMREFIWYIRSLENVNTCILPVGDGVSLSVLE